MPGPVAVTGLGAVTPLGGGADATYRRWADGACGIRDGVGFCDDFDALDHLPLREARRLDRFSALAVVAGDEATRQAGWEDGPPCDPARAACVVGCGMGGFETLEAQHESFLDGEDLLLPLAVPMCVPDAAAVALAIRHEIRGEVLGVAAACSSGAAAIAHAARLIRSDEADVAIAGGAEAPVTELMRTAFASMEATSPSGACRPFDASRDGFVLAEGAGVLVLERPEHAAARGAESLGYLTGCGTTCDAFNMTAPRPDGSAAAEAIERALADAGRSAAEVACVNAHGTGTKRNDRAEVLALERALGNHATTVPISSLKSAIGHAMGAAGAIEAVATLLTLRAGLVPPTLGLERPDDGFDLSFVIGAARPLGPPSPSGGRPLALSSSFGFGGRNVALCLEADRV